MEKSRDAEEGQSKNVQHSSKSIYFPFATFMSTLRIATAEGLRFTTVVVVAESDDSSAVNDCGW